MEASNSYISQLKERLRTIQNRYLGFLQSRQGEPHLKKPNPFSSLGSNPPKGPEISYRLPMLSPKQEREQKNLLRDLGSWHNDMSGLLEYVPDDIESLLISLISDLELSIVYPKITGSPESIDGAIQSFEVICDKIIKVIDDVQFTSTTSPLYVIDTSAIIDCPDISLMASELNSSGSIFIIPTTTVKELEELKSSKRDDAFRRKLTAAIKQINENMAKGNVLEGIRLPDGTIFKMLANEPDFTSLPEGLDPQINDDRIIASAIELQRSNPFSTLTIVANDISMQNKASLARISVKKGPGFTEDIT
jgi:rRNA-processing protein FCF1